jgi:hypothetical protein
MLKSPLIDERHSILRKLLVRAHMWMLNTTWHILPPAGTQHQAVLLC